MPALTSLAAPAAAVFGSQASSSTVRESLRPSTPPLALISSTASWAPSFMYGPMAAELPVSGVSMPSLRVAELLPPPEASPVRSPPHAVRVSPSAMAATAVVPRRMWVMPYSISRLARCDIALLVEHQGGLFWWRDPAGAGSGSSCDTGRRLQAATSSDTEVTTCNV